MYRSLTSAVLLLCTYYAAAAARSDGQVPLLDHASSMNRTVSAPLFYELEELARIVDISYCVGSTGIQKPFLCASRCAQFEGFELVTTWNTGPLLADSCGYIALAHSSTSPRIIVAFRGTYSITNTIVDLSTIPQEYVPYPGEGEGGDEDALGEGAGDLSNGYDTNAARPREKKCENCTVHLGFMTSWKQTRIEILPHLEKAIAKHPTYQLTLVGHSLGGAIAGLASLDFKARGWNPKVTTFGEPRIGNGNLMRYIDEAFFETDGSSNNDTLYRRVTHVNDPIPLLPLEEWGYKMHAGEIYISKSNLPPTATDFEHCEGDEDPKCIAGPDGPSFGVPARFRIWQLVFAHRDYFWRLGVCLPGGDPHDWYRKYPQPPVDEL